MKKLSRAVALVLAGSLLTAVTACTNETQPSTTPTGTPAPTAEAGIYTPGTYTGSAQGFGGLVSAEITVDANAITAVTLTGADETPDIGGKALEKLTASDRSGKTLTLADKGEGKYTFTMPSSAVTVTAAFQGGETAVTLPFTDVAADSWYYDSVAYVYEKGLMGGTGDGLFAPDLTTSRAMIVTILYRLENSPAVTTSAGFTDVATDTWYTDAVNWANANGIVTGYGDGRFGPEDTITREQMAVILYRTAKLLGRDVSARADLSGYTDAANVGEYAVEAMQWAVAQGLLTGTDAGALLPSGSATRSQAAALLMRFCENVLK